MENLKKWFNFSETISGSTFVVRWIAAFVVQFVGGFSLGWGLTRGGWDNGFVMLGLILASAGIVLQFSTLLKRSRSLFTGLKVMYFYITYLVLSLAQGFIKPVSLNAASIVALLTVVMFLYAAFKNSGTPEVDHLG